METESQTGEGTYPGSHSRPAGNRTQIPDFQHGACSALSSAILSIALLPQSYLREREVLFEARRSIANFKNSESCIRPQTQQTGLKPQDQKCGGFLCLLNGFGTAGRHSGDIFHFCMHSHKLTLSEVMEAAVFRSRFVSRTWAFKESPEMESHNSTEDGNTMRRTCLRLQSVSRGQDNR